MLMLSKHSIDKKIFLNMFYKTSLQFKKVTILKTQFLKI
jgi:hypothetical protein